MPDYRWWEENGRKVKGRLTRAERKIKTYPERPTADAARAALSEAEAVLALMDDHGYPDWWHRVDILQRDAAYALMRAEAEAED